MVFAADTPATPAPPAAAAPSAPATSPAAPPPQKHWFDRYSIRGYSQLRYNRLGATNDLLVSEHDRSIGDNNSFLLRRARFIFSGDVNDHLYVYIQPDFAGAVSGASQGNYLQIRDFYGDIAFDAAKEFRIRAGQSKVPFGWENLQSSQNRLAPDRDDALNSAAKDERDLGLFFYWAPAEIRRRFKHLVDSGLKGSGDYGVAAFGIYNGQAANRPEAADYRHLVARLAYPYEFAGGQIVEAGIAGYTGTYTIARSGAVVGGNDFADQRGVVSLIAYPQPIGFQAEFTFGRGPELNAARTSVSTEALYGGYVQTMYKWNNLMPFARAQYYHGGKKHETNAPFSRIRELELGVEWQFFPMLELTGEYVFASRTSNVAPYNQEDGRLARFQLQFSY